MILENVPRYFLFSFFWFFVLTKKLLFWTWLWQLKEYHLKRFLAHFETEKGKKLILNFFTLSKAFSVFGLIFNFSLFLPIVFLIYLLDFSLIFFHFFKKNLRRPVLTKKTFSILVVGFSMIILVPLFLRDFSFQESILFLLIFDFLSPLVFSVLIFCFWPITFFWQRKLIKKATKKREKFKDLLVIGIVGSYGKTSTKEFLAQILSERFNVLKTKEHRNSEVGISQCILNELKPEHEIFVCEMGAYVKGGIKLLCEIAKPKFGILTGVNEQHLATFGSMENLMSAEGGEELIESLPRDGLVIFNGNNKYLFDLYQRTKIAKKIVFSNKNSEVLKKISADLKAKNIRLEKEKIFFEVVEKDGKKADFELNLIGSQNVENFLMAASLALKLGMDLEEIAEISKKIRSFEKTMELKEGRGGVKIVDDSYSANPTGVEAALNYLKIYSGKKIVIMRCLIELGKVSKRIHRKIGKKIGKICDLAIITTKDYFKEIKKGAIESGMKEDNILFLENPKEIFEKIKPYLKPENVILLENRVPGKLIDLLKKLK